MRRSTRPILATSILAVPVLVFGLTNLTSIASAQDAVFVDISDPNVSIDLSVLSDGGMSPSSSAHKTMPMPNSLGLPVAKSTNLNTAAPVAPGTLLPVSTLYIQPSMRFNIPPRTKPLLAAPVSIAVTTTVSAPVIASAPVPAAAPLNAAAPVTKTVAKAVDVVKAPAPVAPVISPVVTAPIAPPPAPVLATVVEPAAPAAPVVVAKVAPPAPVVVVKEVAKAITPPPATPAPLTPPVKAPVAPTPPAIAKVDVVKVPEVKAEKVIASIPPASKSEVKDGQTRIVFEPETSKMPKNVRALLKSLAETLQGNNALRLQLLAYAGNADTSSSAARRLSLSRALAVRSYLIESGVRSTRIDVRALGNKSTDPVTERVDITIVER